MPAITLHRVSFFEHLFLLLLLPFLAAQLAFANHVTCSYKPGPGSPRQYGYRGFCDAGLENGGYKCLPGRTLLLPKEGALVATWGQLGGNVFEWLCPCADKGYGRRPDDGVCISPQWAICLSQNTEDCLYMAGGDDCQWPNYILEPPKTVYIFYHSDETNLLEEE